MSGWEEVDSRGHVGADVDGEQEDVEKEELRNPEKMNEFWTCQNSSQKTAFMFWNYNYLNIVFNVFAVVVEHQQQHQKQKMIFETKMDHLLEVTAKDFVFSVLYSFCKIAVK